MTKRPAIDQKAGWCSMCRSDTHELCAVGACKCPDHKRQREAARRVPAPVRTELVHSVDGQGALFADLRAIRRYTDGDFRVWVSRLGSELKMGMAQVRTVVGFALAEAARRWGEKSDDYESLCASYRKITEVDQRTLSRWKSKAQVTAFSPDTMSGEFSANTNKSIDSKIAGGEDVSAVRPALPAQPAGVEAGYPAAPPPPAASPAARASGSQLRDGGVSDGREASGFAEPELASAPPTSPAKARAAAGAQDDAGPRVTANPRPGPASAPHDLPSETAGTLPAAPHSSVGANGQGKAAGAHLSLVRGGEPDLSTEGINRFLLELGKLAPSRLRAVDGIALARGRNALNREQERRDREQANGSLRRGDVEPRFKREAGKR